MSDENQTNQPIDDVQDATEQDTQEQTVETDAQATEGLTVDEARIHELEAALAVAEATVAEQKDTVLRAKADADNARRRAEGEVDKARKFALERFAGELLPVIDNLERALQVIDTQDENLKPMAEGVEITLKSFMSTVEKFGMTIVDPQGETFNPEHHQAMSMQESAEHAPNTVMAVMQKGYLLNGRLLRPAMVMVSRAASGGVNTEA